MSNANDRLDVLQDVFNWQIAACASGDSGFSHCYTGSYFGQQVHFVDENGTRKFYLWRRCGLQEFSSASDLLSSLPRISGETWPDQR